MIEHEVRVHPSAEELDCGEQLAWKTAEVAAERVDPEPEVADMVINRLLDDLAVAAASLHRRAPTRARDPDTTTPDLPRRRGPRAGRPRHLPDQ